MKEHLSAPGQVDQWLDGSEIALENGDFTKIKYHKRNSQITAEYGADRISIDFSMKDANHVLLRIESTDEKVLGWYKSCVTDVMLHPDKYQNTYDQAPYEEPLKDDWNDQIPDDSSHYPGDQDEGNTSDNTNEQVAPKTMRKKWNVLSAKTGFIVLMLLVVPPFGIYLLVHHRKFGLVRRAIIIGIAVLYTLFIWVGFLGVNTGVNKTSVTQFFTGLTNHSTQTTTEVTPTPTTDVDSEY
ncbi:MAG: tripartite tricarboxylate transporter TctB family protein [Eubacteriaceae bacterium]|nr:tripartite tricarboxylate transporter TctB family protein [Eubacteriaceae bacterium]MDD4508024.1 tripartite tricarboxylate transporter TctB family protein [Eubacteriaceae bacterium]